MSKSVKFAEARLFTVEESLKYYRGLPIRCGYSDDGDLVLNANDTLAVLCVINGEIECVTDQPRLNSNQAVKELGRIASQYKHTLETQDFHRWLSRCISKNEF